MCAKRRFALPDHASRLQLRNGGIVVAEIAQQHGAEIEIYNNPHSNDKAHPGSLFRVSLALQEKPAAAEESVSDGA